MKYPAPLGVATPHVRALQFFPHSTGYVTLPRASPASDAPASSRDGSIRGIAIAGT